MRITVIGTGYVGLVTGACFSEMGFHVTCIDINSEKIERLNRSEIPIYEPGLEEIVLRSAKAERLTFTTKFKEAIEESLAIFLAVDTPSKEDGTCDLNSLRSAAMTCAQYLNDYKVIVNKSTVPVGTAKTVRKIIQEVLDRRKVSLTFDIVSNPEFLKEGCAVADFMRPDRVIIGRDSPRAEEVMRELYKPFMLSQDRFCVMDIASSELTKYAANAMLATRISFMNWLSELCEEVGADITQVRRGIGSDKRIGLSFLWAGCGFGGSCFPKDLAALSTTFREHKISSQFLDCVIDINERQKQLLFSKIASYFRDRGGLAHKTIAILGLSFKPDTDDMRKAPVLPLIEALCDADCELRLYDPVAMPNARKILAGRKKIHWCSNEKEAATAADALVLVTEWKQFRLLNFDELSPVMKGHAFFDGRNQYEPEKMAAAGFDYVSVGRLPAWRVFAREFVAPKEAVQTNA
jgi:UDPglucose 6-dehydrogenase